MYFNANVKIHPGVFTRNRNFRLVYSSKLPKATARSLAPCESPVLPPILRPSSRNPFLCSTEKELFLASLASNTTRDWKDGGGKTTFSQILVCDGPPAVPGSDSLSKDLIAASSHYFAQSGSTFLHLQGQHLTRC